MWPGNTPRTCTLCGTGFRLVGPNFTNPADLLCNACIAQLWADDRDDAVLEAEYAPRISADSGFDPKMIASAIVRRGHQLRDYARTEDELRQVLAQRDPGGS